MAVVFDLLRAIAEYRFRIKNGISWGTFCFQIGDYERVKGRYDDENLSLSCWFSRDFQGLSYSVIEIGKNFSLSTG